jgi:hypothetical protein
MARTDEIKSWIRNLQKGKPSSPDAILIGRDAGNRVTVTLLDHACCTGVICLDRELETLRPEDLQKFEASFNHRH